MPQKSTPPACRVLTYFGSERFDRAVLKALLFCSCAWPTQDLIAVGEATPATDDISSSLLVIQCKRLATLQAI